MRPVSGALLCRCQHAARGSARLGLLGFPRPGPADDRRCCRAVVGSGGPRVGPSLRAGEASARPRRSSASAGRPRRACSREGVRAAGRRRPSVPTRPLPSSLFPLATGMKPGLPWPGQASSRGPRSTAAQPTPCLAFPDLALRLGGAPFSTCMVVVRSPHHTCRSRTHSPRCHHAAQILAF